MFEVDVKSPAEFGVFVSFLALNRGPLSVLVHPHRRGPQAESEARPGRDITDHVQYGFWMGEKHHLNFNKFVGPPPKPAVKANV
jgi:DOPA 4,5-dioxygenase